MDWTIRRNCRLREIEGLLWDGEITDEEAEEMMCEWDEMRELAEEERWEAVNGR